MVQRVGACAQPDVWAVTVYFHPLFFFSFSPPPQQEMLEWSKAEKLNQALSLVLAIFHMDLEHLTHSLLLTLMPRLLLSTIHTHVLIDPHGFILAKLCVLCITGTQTSKIGQKGGFLLGLSVGGWLLGRSVCLPVGGWLLGPLSVLRQEGGWLLGLSLGGCLVRSLSFVRKVGGCLVCLWVAAWSALCPSSVRWVLSFVRKVCGCSVCLSFIRKVGSCSVYLCVCPLSERWVAAQSVCLSFVRKVSGWLVCLCVCPSSERWVASQSVCVCPSSERWVVAWSVCLSLDRKVCGCLIGPSTCLSKFINRLRALLLLTFKGAKCMDIYIYMCVSVFTTASVCIQIWFQIFVVDLFSCYAWGNS